MQEEEVVLVIVTMMIFAGIGVLYMAMSNRRALREMEHRERLAMIQRGLIPSPETDPLGFETAAAAPFETNPSIRSDRWRSAGVMIIGLGLALMMLLSFTAGEPGVGIGVGGAFAILGGTLLLNSMQMKSEAPRYRTPPGSYRQAEAPRSTPPPPRPPEL